MACLNDLQNNGYERHKCALKNLLKTITKPNGYENEVVVQWLIFKKKEHFFLNVTEHNECYTSMLFPYWLCGLIKITLSICNTEKCTE